MFNHRGTQRVNADDLLVSKLYDQDSFYDAFTKDLKNAKSQVIIESPFMTTRRVNLLIPMFITLRKCGVQLVINTKPIDEHEPGLYAQAEQAIAMLQVLGVLVLFTGGHHRKLAIIDREVVWEGSLNILSQNDSCEIMRRIESKDLAREMLRFIKLGKFL
jgi:phosphatidylserine/phosphatidylglycerophosphate/cardiolipin synthase-like enzyme